MLKVLIVVVSLTLLGAASTTPLDDYVNAPDVHYRYELIKTYEQTGTGCRVFVLNMTSQKWKDETFVVNPVWWHYVVVSVPPRVLRPDAAFLFIQGGSQGES